MTMLRTVRMFARYNAWANKLIFDAVAKLPEAEATKERPTLFKNMVHTLNHRPLAQSRRLAGHAYAVRSSW